ncbi:hypothetical protein MTR_2g095810 [Medicago truncatula]|uniref:Uncharacterized protein n=1 Tax=Medicago truncatula TaxID=3880 RepID=G7IU72_MEDTR|nr:hypothetical protein MTR_2g095810 [Medicago truncatula]
MSRLLLMFSSNAIFSGMTGHPTNAAFSPLIFHNVHLGPNASNCGTTFLYGSERARIITIIHLMTPYITERSLIA